MPLAGQLFLLGWFTGLFVLMYHCFLAPLPDEE